MDLRDDWGQLTYLSMESILLLHSKSIIKSSEQIDSHGDKVSKDSVRVITD